MNRPERVQKKVFSEDSAALSAMGRAGAKAAAESKRLEKNRKVEVDEVAKTRASEEPYDGNKPVMNENGDIVPLDDLLA